MSRRGIIIGAAVFAAAVAIVLVLVIALGGKDEERGETAPHGPPTTGVTETTGTTGAPRTQTAEALTDTGPRRPRRNAAAARVEQALLDLVAAAERGQPPAGIDPTILPSSDELSIERTEIEGDRATVALAGGVVVAFRRSGDGWTAVSARRAP